MAKRKRPSSASHLPAEPAAQIDDRCPCDSGSSYDRCCGPLHLGEKRAATCEQLMRARYSAHVVGDDAFLLATWDPSTRPTAIGTDPAVHWTGLVILGTTKGNLLDQEGTVEFIASYQRDAHDATTLQHRELSRFVRADSRWVYLDAV